MILVYDIGTTTVKGAIFESGGKLMSTASVPVRLLKSENPVYHECDPNSWLSAIALINPQLGVTKGSKIDAVVVSGNGPTVVPVGEDGRPVDFAITWMDRRAVGEAEVVSGAVGFNIDPSFALPKICWLYKNKYEIYERTQHFLHCPEFVNFFLTGEANTILPSPEFKKYIWTDEALDELGLDRDKFPVFVKPGCVIGEVRKQAGDSLGIPAGVPVIAGGPDFVMSLLGTATVVPGRVCDRAGTSEGVNLCSLRGINDTRLLSLPHIIEGYYNISGIISTSGKALEWFKDITGKGELDYETLFEDICLVEPGANKLVFLPYLSGERSPIWDPNARGVFIGLSLKHGRKEMMRAIVESVGFAVRDVLLIMEENGFAIEDLRVTGGQARSPLWNQIKADITGKNIILPECSDAELKGDAAVALKALGIYGSLKEAAEKSFRVKKVFKPNRNLKGLYDDLFGVYRESYRALQNIFADMAGVETPGIGEEDKKKEEEL